MSDNEDSDESQAEHTFSQLLRKNPEDLQQQIDALLQQGEKDMLAGAFFYLRTALQQRYPQLFAALTRSSAEPATTLGTAVLSRLVVDKSYRILLPDYGNMEVKMTPLPKAVYLLFLRHPEGIRLKELYLYRDELTDIYERLTGRSDLDDVRETIRNLTDYTQPLLSQKCSRIRQAFRRLIDEDTARWYYISGKNGEPKKIELPRELVSNENQHR